VSVQEQELNNLREREREREREMDERREEAKRRIG